jgi:hypothetical protein
VLGSLEIGFSISIPGGKYPINVPNSNLASAAAASTYLGIAEIQFGMQAFEIFQSIQFRLFLASR